MITSQASSTVCSALWTTFAFSGCDARAGSIGPARPVAAPMSAPTAMPTTSVIYSVSCAASVHPSRCHRLLDQGAEFQEFNVFRINGQATSQSLLSLCKSFSAHLNQGRNVTVPDLLFDCRRGDPGATKAQAHAITIVKRMIPEPMGGADRAFRRNPRSAANDSLFSDRQAGPHRCRFHLSIRGWPDRLD